MKKIRHFIAPLIVVALAGASQAAGPSKALILPFSIHAEEDLAFLRHGIEDMLSSRLTREDELIPISGAKARRAMKGISGKIDERTAASVGGKFDYDYVVFGSITVFGESISTDAKFFDVRRKKTIVTFFESGKTKGDVIAHVNAFASRINETLFGEVPLALRPSATPADDRRKDPNKLWSEPKAEPAPPGPKPVEIPPSPKPETPVATATPAAPVESAKPVDGKKTSAPSEPFWKSRAYKTFIKGLSAGDVDGDGRIETVFIDDNHVYIHRLENGAFRKLAEIKGRHYYDMIGVDVADINKNGKSEIFVTNMNTERGLVRSFVLEWNGSEFSKIAKDAKWYFRVVRIPGRGDVLLGQKRNAERIFTPGIYELEWKTDNYHSKNRVPLPRWANVFGVAFGNVLNDGREAAVAFSQHDYLHILGPDGNEEWKSSEEYGGSANYMKYPSPASASISGEKEMEHFYLPQRILIADSDKDGKYEIVVTKNEDMTSRVFSRFRLYKSGHLEFLEWDGLGLYPKYEAKEISGYISDYAIADTDNDGRDEIMFPVVTEIGSILGKAKSHIVSKDINSDQLPVTSDQ